MFDLDSGAAIAGGLIDNEEGRGDLSVGDLSVGTLSVGNLSVGNLLAADFLVRADFGLRMPVSFYGFGFDNGCDKHV